MAAMSWRTFAFKIPFPLLPWALFVQTGCKLLGIKAMIWPIYTTSAFLVAASTVAILFAYLSDCNSHIAKLYFFPIIWAVNFCCLTCFWRNVISVCTYSNWALLSIVCVVFFFFLWSVSHFREVMMHVFEWKKMK